MRACDLYVGERRSGMLTWGGGALGKVISAGGGVYRRGSVVQIGLLHAWLVSVVRY